MDQHNINNPANGSDSADNPTTGQNGAQPVVPTQSAFIFPQNFTANFIEHLRNSNRLDPAAADRAARAANETGENIETVLTELGLVSVGDMTDILADFLEIGTASERDMPPAQLLEDLLNCDFLARNTIIVLEATDAQIVLAIANPRARNELETIRFITERDISVKLASRLDIETAIQRYRSLSTDEFDQSSAANDHGTASQEDIQRLRDTASEAPVIRTVNRLIEAAVNAQASDIHIEPMVDGTRIRFRIDGQLREIERLPNQMQAGVVSRIKILARLDIAERRLPQDGRTKFVAGGRNIDLRISTIPVLYGESVVLRILDIGQVELSYPALGFEEEQIAIFDRILARPNGIVLVTGPTGSGKTTTLYSALRDINSVERKLFTVEDPIEYELAGVNQIQAAPTIGMGFAEALRSILRQDPDVIMVGEMRDLETARIGIQAALTGHLVLSTLHTNSACTSVTRMLDIGVQDYLLGSSLIAVVAQRLVRRLCPHCATPSPETAKQIQSLGLMPKAAQSKLPLEPFGCDECHHTGYSGRTTIAEFLVMDDELRAHITSDTNSVQLEKLAREKGMKTLLENGISKVLDGQTSLEEVMMVANL